MATDVAEGFPMPEKKDVGPQGLAQALADARKLGKTLGAETDNLNKLIQEAEASIEALRLGVQGRVTLPSDSEDPLDVRMLCFQRYDDKWRLVLRDGYEDPSEETDYRWRSVTPLSNCSREERLEAADYLSDIVADMVAQATVELEKVQKKNAVVRSFLLNLAAGQS